MGFDYLNFQLALVVELLLVVGSLLVPTVEAVPYLVCSFIFNCLKAWVLNVN